MSLKTRLGTDVMIDSRVHPNMFVRFVSFTLNKQVLFNCGSGACVAGLSTALLTGLLTGLMTGLSDIQEEKSKPFKQTNWPNFFQINFF